MNEAGKEIEVKFYLSKRQALEEKLKGIGAQLKAPRVLETNLRFDTPEQSLLNSGRLLRLRKDTRARITYKGVGEVHGGARLRQELEITVSDFDTARELLEALGYQVTMMYEKYRTTYEMANLEVTLDEMPYGDFAEIEGPDGESIQKAAQQLGLVWEARTLDSYTVLFERARGVVGFTFRDLSFDNFKGSKITPAVLGVKIADRGQ